MSTCVAKREGKLIDARFVRPLNPRERSKMEDHLSACAVCRERYRKMQLADRVVAFGPDAELDRPAPIEVERIAQDLGLFESPRRPRTWFAMPFLGAMAAAALAAVLFLRPSDELVERGTGPSGITFSAYAISRDGGPRLLETGAPVSSSEHLKLRMAWGQTRELAGVEVLLVSGGKIEHVHLDAPDRTGDVASVPGAISLSGLEPGDLTAYVVASKTFDLDRVRELASKRAPPEELARVLGEASVERIDLEVRE